MLYMLYLSKSTNRKKKEIQLIYKRPKISEGDNTGFSSLLFPQKSVKLIIYYFLPSSFPPPHWKFLLTTLRFKWPCGFFRHYRTRSRYSEGRPLTFYGNASSNLQYNVSLHWKIQRNNLNVRETNRCYEEQNQRFEWG